MGRSAIRGPVPHYAPRHAGYKQTAGAVSRPGVMLSKRSSLRRVEAGDGLHFEEVLEAVLAPLAAVAGLLVAAERRAAVVGHTLQIHVAGADLAADALGVLDRSAGDVAREAIGGVVG